MDPTANLFEMKNIGDEIIVDASGKNITRGSCESENSEYIWHTHPNISKYYPSLEDIQKVLKNKNITIQSNIYTQYGYWIIKIKNENKLNLKIYDYSNVITPLLNNFYWKTEKGRAYNENEVNYLCMELNRLLPCTIEFISF
jgi:hypothetical protein